MYILILGTKQGVFTAFKQDKTWVKAGQSLINRQVTSLTASGGLLFAGTTEGIYRAPIDSSGTGSPAAISELVWQRLLEGIGSPHIRYLAAYPGENGRILAGTEPAGIYITKDWGENWSVCREVADLRDRRGWSLPYSPEAGCVRGFAFHGQRAYAAVEDGCVLISNDRGETWQVVEGSSGYSDHSPASGFIHSDVHSIEVHPSSGDLVTAPTGGGLYQSIDGGSTWSNLYRCYTRAAWLDPVSPDLMIFGPAVSVDRGGRIEITRDGGKTWKVISTRLGSPWRDHMVERFVSVNGDLLAILSNGQLVAAKQGDLDWEFILPDIPFVLSTVGIVIGD